MSGAWISSDNRQEGDDYLRNYNSHLGEVQRTYGAIAAGGGRRGSAARENLSGGGDAEARAALGSNIVNKLARLSNKERGRYLRKKKNREQLEAFGYDLSGFYDAGDMKGRGSKSTGAGGRITGFDIEGFKRMLEVEGNPYSVLGSLAAQPNTTAVAPPLDPEATVEPVARTTGDLPTAKDVNVALSDTENPTPKPTDITQKKSENQDSYRRV